MQRIFLAIFISITIAFGISCNKPSDILNNGTWRGALITESGVEIPFNFIVIDSLGAKSIKIINAKEQFQVDEIAQREDSIFIKMPLFDSEIKGHLADGRIEGIWIKHLADKDVSMEFQAQENINWRIKKEIKKPLVNISGRWATTFLSTNKEDTTFAVGEFVQEGTKVSGTFLTATGDYRFLDGVVDGDELSLSTFDGSHAFLFTAKVTDSTLTEGKFYSGFSSVETFTAKKDSTAKLPDAYSLTYLKEGYNKISFSFPDLSGKKISLEDDQIKNKVVVLQLLGSWCPNCMDETAFLASYQNKNKFDDVAIIGLAYERTTDFQKSKLNLEKVIKRFDVNYPFLITGYTNKKGEPAKSLPMLNHVMAFPTMIVIDKKGKVREIHTGFSGPGTGKYYEEFAVKFDKLIQNLRSE